MNCDHKKEEGSYDYETEDNRCDTDRGTMGALNHFCKKCDEDITEEVYESQVVYDDEER